mgnify:CR=1 FL=1
MKPKDILTNRAFCPIPWTGLMYNFDGTVKNCIRSDKATGQLGNIQDNTIEEILLGSVNVTKQENIIAQRPANGCHTCYDLERGKKGFDIISDRIFYIREFKRTPVGTYQPNNFDLQTIDVRWTNLCNFACVYCGPEFSSKWADELDSKIVTPTEEQLAQFKEYIYKNAKNLKHVYLAGGEPLINHHVYKLLKLISEKTSQPEIVINSNIASIKPHFIDVLKQLKQVSITVSIDGFGLVNEYHRWPLNWDKFYNNLLMLNNIGVYVSWNTVIDSISVWGLKNLLAIEHLTNAWNLRILTAPEELRLRNLSTEIKPMAKNQLQSLTESKFFLTTFFSLNACK